MAGKKKSTKGKIRKEKKRHDQHNRLLMIRESEQEYGQITALLGDCRVRVKCMDGQNRLGRIRGKMRHRERIRASDWVLLTLRDFEDEKCDIVHKYSDDEVRKLKQRKEIHDFNEDEDANDAAGVIVFENNPSEDEDEDEPKNEEDEVTDLLAGL